MVRRRDSPGPKDRTFQLSMELLVNTSYPTLDLNVRQALFVEIGEFFLLTSRETLTIGELQQVRPQSLQGQNIRILSADAIISGNRSDFSFNMLERKTDLADFLGGCCQVTQMSVTCGQGHEGIANRTFSESADEMLNADCAPCPRGYYKEALDNSLCIQCPRHMSTQSGGATNQAQCECEPGYSLFDTSSDNASSAENIQVDPRNGTCIPSGILTAATASQAASVVSITLGTVIGTAVASAVGHLVIVLCLVATDFKLLTTRFFPFQVASGVAGALAGSAGGAAAGAGVNSCFPQ